MDDFGEIVEKKPIKRGRGRPKKVDTTIIEEDKVKPEENAIDKDKLQPEEIEPDAIDKDNGEAEDTIQIEDEPKNRSKKKLHVFDKPLEHFHRKREAIMKFINKKEIHQTYRLSAVESGDTCLIIYQSARQNEIAKFRHHQYDEFKQGRFQKMFVKQIGKEFFDIKE